MGKLVSDVIEIGSLGLIDDPLGIEAGEEAAQRASDVQVAGTEAGIAERRRQFNITQENLKPFQEAGVGALEQQQALLGLLGKERQQELFLQLEESPGQQFLRKRQERSLLRNASAIGGLGGGNVRTALQEQAVGFGQQDIQNQFGRLGQVAGQGQTAATNVGQFGSAASRDIANLNVAGSEARASGILGKQQVGAQATGQVLQLGAQFAGAFV